MRMTLKFLLLLITFYHVNCWNVGKFLGCYKDLPSNQTYNTDHIVILEQCAADCSDKYYRYAYIRNEGCICGNYLGQLVSNTTCTEYCPACDIKPILADTYSTGNLVPGPPRNVQITNVTENSLHISWSEPESFVDIISYDIKANILKTYSGFSETSPEWTYSNNTFQTELIALLPATKYNVTIGAKSIDGDGKLWSKVIETLIGEPNDIPDQPKVLDQDGTTMTISLTPTSNNNGPVTNYRIVVVNEDFKQSFNKSRLLPYDQAQLEGLPYYIAAEISPQKINEPFIVGDGTRSGIYYNAPLNPNTNYIVLVGIVSKLNGVVKEIYSNITGTQNGILILNIDEGNPAVIIGLSVSIGLLSIMLVIGIIGFFILKSKVTNRRIRLTDNQELTLQGPAIEVENHGYIPEEDIIVNHYKDLRQKVPRLVLNQLNIEHGNVLGIGKYGKVVRGSLSERNGPTPIAVYTIVDEGMAPDIRRSMLKDLDLLIRTQKHENTLKLFGTCETPETVYIAMEFVSMNLKDLLLGSREQLPGRFSNMSEQQALDIAIQIANGMCYLESCKVIHKQLCARSILVAQEYIVKISCYGLSQYHNNNNTPDYTRWTAFEVFKNSQYNPKSDVWSFGCVLWEICVLGGTPYGNISDANDIPKNIMAGIRLPQLRYIGDEFYEIMLDCWQLDPDVRPNFHILQTALENLKEQTFVPFLSFNLHSNFQYEQFYPDMERAVRPVY